MIDLATVSRAKSITISDLKKRASRIHQEVVDEWQVHALRFGDHEDMAIVSLEGLVELAAKLQRELATLTGVPLLGGPEEDDLLQRRLSEPRISDSEVPAATRAKLGLE